MGHQRGRLYSGGERRFGQFRRKSGRFRRPAEIGVDDDLAVISQINRFELVELLAPFLQMGFVNLVAIEIVRRPQVDQYRTRRIVREHFDVVGIGEVDFAQLLRIVRAACIELADQVVIDFHARAASGERLTGIHPQNYGERKLLFARRRELHQRPGLIDQLNLRADAGEGNRGALVDFHLNAVRHEAHYASGFDPGNLLELRLAFGERNKKDVAADVTTHDFHDLRFADALKPGDFDVVARLDAEAPRVFSVMVCGGGRDGAEQEHGSNDDSPSDASGSFFRERTAADGDALLSA